MSVVDRYSVLGRRRGRRPHAAAKTDSAAVASDIDADAEGADRVVAVPDLVAEESDHSVAELDHDAMATDRDAGAAAYDTVAPIHVGAETDQIAAERDDGSDADWDDFGELRRREYHERRLREEREAWMWGDLLDTHDIHMHCYKQSGDGIQRRWEGPQQCDEPPGFVWCGKQACTMPKELRAAIRTLDWRCSHCDKTNEAMRIRDNMNVLPECMRCGARIDAPEQRC